MASLLVFVWLQRFDHGALGVTPLTLIFVPPFMLSTALTDATFPLEESVLMDFVPTSSRGRWKSLESVRGEWWYLETGKNKQGTCPPRLCSAVYIYVCPLFALSLSRSAFMAASCWPTSALTFPPPLCAAQVAAFGWCGSAVLGGYLVDKYDYSFTFALTAAVQCAAVAVWCCLIPLVPRTEGRAEGHAENHAEGHAEGHAKGRASDNDAAASAASQSANRKEQEEFGGLGDGLGQSLVTSPLVRPFVE